MEEGQIARWVKNEGDKFDANETLAEVDTDKATMEMTSLEAGTLMMSIALGADLVSSLRVCAKVKCVSKSPPGKSFSSCNCRA